MQTPEIGTLWSIGGAAFRFVGTLQRRSVFAFDGGEWGDLMLSAEKWPETPFGRARGVGDVVMDSLMRPLADQTAAE